MTSTTRVAIRTALTYALITILTLATYALLMGLA